MMTKRTQRRLWPLWATLSVVAATHLIGFGAAADILHVEYKTLYSHTKKIDNEDTQGLQFAFGFLKVPEKTQLCQIHSAYIKTDKKDIPLNVSPESRFTVPSEKALRLADAIVLIDMQEPSNQCDISVQLETKPAHLKLEYTTADLAYLSAQYANFFNEMGGFMSFMMPQVTGLQFVFDDPELSLRLNDKLSIIKGVMRVSHADIQDLNGISLPVKPLRITALTSK